MKPLKTLLQKLNILITSENAAVNM